MPKLDEIPLEWEYPDEGSPLKAGSITLLDFLSAKIFDDYEPTQFIPFRQRLLMWLNNVESTEEQQFLLALLLDVFYVGRHEFESMYRSVYRHAVFQWLLEGHNISPFVSNLENRIRNLANKSWICPISDSLRINSFLKINGLKSRDKRPDWRSLEQFADAGKIRDYVDQKKIVDLVLLEDFVGSGIQASSSIKFAARILPDVRILLAPLVVCPTGNNDLHELVKKFSNITYMPNVVLPQNAIQCYETFKNGNGSALDIFLAGLYKRLKFRSEKGMFGFMQTGAKVVMYSNCPNNSLPVFHKETPNWAPLFPRVTRE